MRLFMDGISLAKANRWVDVISSLPKLSDLSLEGCELSQVMYPHSSFLNSSSSSIEFLYLENNNLNSSMHRWLFLLINNNLSTLDLSGNMLDGIPKYLVNLSSLYSLDFNNNSAVVKFPDFLNNLHLDLSFCNLGPHFPRWIQTLKNLTRLDISNTRISDTVPPEFWNMQLSYLNLSANNISGEVPDLSSSFAVMIDLSCNSFNGPIPHLPPRLASLNLSRNKFSGGIFFVCQFVDVLLEFLDLWHFKQLKIRNQGHNSLFGKLPVSVASLINLEVLYLYKNNFSGELPLSLKNCTKLNFLDLGANGFSGNMPAWIGENLSGLYGLILRSNNFFGTIPLQLCQLPNLQILDFSRNNLHGSIPSCLSNLTRMAQEGFLPPPNVHPYTTRWYPHAYTPPPHIPYSALGNKNCTEEEYDDQEYVDHAMIDWQGDEREFTHNLGLLKSIDLSSNNLTGHIPYELTNLHELLALNLSKNALHGEIPQQVGQMKNLLALDLSRNRRIPCSTQLQSFEPSRYDGNAGLCGPPLSRKCPGDEVSQVTLIVGKSEGDGEDRDEEWGWFYIGGGAGFATGFWIACGTLLLNRHGRHAFFHFYDNFKGWVYEKVVVVYFYFLFPVMYVAL
ncbi:hypothetical protein Lser_V15G29220 [Lactuca serriola]